MAYVTGGITGLRTHLSPIDPFSAMAEALGELQAVFERTTHAMGALAEQCEQIIQADIASLNDTQRAIYQAHRRSGMYHCDIMHLLD